MSQEGLFSISCADVVAVDQGTSGRNNNAVDGNVVIVVSGQDETMGNVYIDCSLATENMNLMAQALGYGARIYTSSATNMSDELKVALEIPDGYTPITVLQVGYYEDYQDAIST